MSVFRFYLTFDFIRLSIYCILGGLFFHTRVQAQHTSCGVNQYYEHHILPAPATPMAILESRSAIVLSVVIHVVWNKSQENISDQQIYAQLDRLNQDFNDPYLNKLNVPKEFRSSIDNPQLRFCLASKDPSGKKHNGITRTQTNIEFIGSKKDANNLFLIHYTSKGGADGWDPSRYINIWIGQLDNIFGRSTIGGRVPILAEDGIVVDPDYFKTDLNEHKYGRTLVHEMGHYLGLMHTWGMTIGDCSEEDGLADTPVQEGPYYDCPSYPQLSCNTSNMFMNYMDFVDDICVHFFTKDQVKLMLSILNTARNSLMLGSSSCTQFPTPVNLDSLGIKILPGIGIVQFTSSVLPDQTLDFIIFNVLGQKMAARQLLITQSGEINIKDWPRGIYFLYFRYNKDYKTLKFFKP